MPERDADTHERAAHHLSVGVTATADVMPGIAGCDARPLSPGVTGTSNVMPG
jgi:hypothetical protein